MEFKINERSLISAEDLVFDQDTGFYARSHGSAISKVTETVATAYRQQDAFIFPSGMNAIYNTLKLVCIEKLKKKGNGTILFSNEMYCDTPKKVIPMLRNEYPTILFKAFDIYNQNDLTQAIQTHKDDLFAVFMESASNPNSQMIDWNSLRIPSEALLIVDNTWLTPIILNPFDYKVDIVVDSCTKYLSNGRCIGGVAVFKGHKFLVKQMQNMLKSIGNHVTPINCMLITDGIKNLRDILEKISNRTEKILDHLKSNPHIDRLVHPSIPTHPSYKKFQKYTNGHNIGIIYFRIPNSRLKKSFRYDICNIVKDTSIAWHTSYGKSYDLFCRYCTKDSVGVWLRLSIGYDDNPMIFDDLDFVCNKISRI